MNLFVLRFLKLVLVTAIFQLVLYKSDADPEQFTRVISDLNGKLDIIVKFLVETPFNLTRSLKNLVIS